MTNKHPFHIVDYSPWPLINSMNLMNMLCMALMYIKNYENINYLLSTLMVLLYSMFLWWRDITRESTFQGNHTYMVYNGLKISMILFISSEIMFFLSFFWSFFHFSLAPELELGNNWPPQGILMINPYHIPLLNTALLLSSGVTVTWAHYSILSKKYYTSMFSLILTILLGISFSFLQYFEYQMTEFSLNDGVFGSVFFMTTGFHGLHVLIGTTFLIVNLSRLIKMHFNNNHHFSFEAAAWYWHFVDVVWIYLYIFMYWWYF
uniref:Cytochrome c oxidase subunit 3 n=1 Tax=Phytoseiulus persimilis TaxID=44414 RepID=D5HKW4_PHYPM|nr:cytochrome c oxidase subunit III [Phytoseiulus persimilis]